MATESRPQDPAVETSVMERLLRDEPYRFKFFQAVRLLSELNPDRAPVGQFSRPSQEVVRFGTNSELGFPASEIYGIEWPAGSQPHMRVNFMGLTGPMGLLPMYYSALLRERLRAQRYRYPRFSGYLQSPHALVLLPGLGEISLHGCVCARRAGPLLAPSAGSDRPRDYGTCKNARLFLMKRCCSIPACCLHRRAPPPPCGSSCRTTSMCQSKSNNSSARGIRWKKTLSAASTVRDPIRNNSDWVL